ncbi:MAG: tRNA uridine(34) 5-carboxymethylaminomethyl modification radical SAM/GNAT enzyme Elp3 [Candidatus Diapherotrites archaeon]|uniref:tRNA carboxymethyluridine synthase n=1 Tax=Candidatus Iainarchaeum sp. TaxID=3101447 RepID=A0A7J4K0R9_9ARCH|nr:MAG: elongator complex protein 3 [archaeon GW2011_AR21]MBS3058669.1 tRNA uridine(34) 5-carboxymethylaminomethyl modification radical SAM/GNAT enzyme Elp3 [Candidatus Diapherotrites archaeon]HIH21757.1 tRNA uridine(34) 5-carboxymethylaminomethyl modification radical SAM/GNAT enzyme Elp3 [Candidatus Diapherotrites archaeon]
MKALQAYSLEIIQAINEDRVKDKNSLNKLKNTLCKKYSIAQAPTNAVILQFAKKPFEQKLLNVLEMKPVKSISGITAVALMPLPKECPGACVYCPNSLVGKKTPKSYTGGEPATLRALQAGFDVKKQIQGRIQQLEEMGHSAEKIELIVMGGTFPSTSFPFQKKFMLECFEAVNGRKTKYLEKAKKLAEKARHRLVGITFETRPDYCGRKEINRMLDFGATRVELGVQTVFDDIYKKINRGHKVKDVIGSTQLLKDSALKVCYHLMPGLPYSSFKKDLQAFRKVFENQEFKPDMLKIYPCLVIKGTKLYNLWMKGSFEPLSTEKAAELIAKVKESIPPWIRVMRIQRDIPRQLVEAGVQHSNLRQLVHEKLAKKEKKCSCIRCREIGLKEYLQKEKPDFESLAIKRMDYKASNGKEVFLQMQDSAENLYGFLRLRFPFQPFRKELQGSALVRELHVFGEALALKQRKEGMIQHFGIGKQLLKEAEEIAKAQGFRKISVISGIGVKEYYRKQGYSDSKAFVTKEI